MFADLLSYDPSTVDPKYRDQVASVLRARGEFLRASAEVAELRARAWAGEDGLTGIIELKGADLTALRQDHMEKALTFLQDVVNLDQLKSLVPMLMMAVLQNLNVPLPVIGEAIGLDFDAFTLLASQLKEVFDELS
ncbi:MAG TPA: hypothetical protein VIY48_03975 [Candidatus Paceibacterota bacterium]